MSAAPQLRAARAADSLARAAGLGLRFAHQRAFLDERPRVAWLEVHAENYMGHSAATRALEAIRANYPVALHGVGLSLGSAGPVDALHLKRLQALARRIEPCLVSEHLSWNRVHGQHLPDLLPLPLTEEALAEVCTHVDQVQHELNRQILLENPSSYYEYAHSTLTEPEFLSALVARTGCGVLCDINNIHVSAQNHGWDAEHYLLALPAHAVKEYHLAGHGRMSDEDGSWLVDDHGSAVPPAVWELYRHALRIIGPRPTLLERDNHIPPLAELLAEVETAGQLLAEAAS